jgi:cytochrome c-type biogenesis protein CcmH/NrfG
MLLAVGTGWYVGRPQERVEVPTVDPAGADREVVAAIETASTEVHRSPRSPAAWGQLGKVLVAHSYYDEANTCFIRAQELDPRDPRWPYLHGLTLRFSDTDRAIAQIQRAVQLQGDAPAMRLRLAEALLEQGRLDEAEEQYRRLLDLDPGNPRGFLGLGRLAYQRGDMRTSREHLDKRPPVL